VAYLTITTRITLEDDEFYYAQNATGSRNVPQDAFKFKLLQTEPQLVALGWARPRTRIRGTKFASTYTLPHQNDEHGSGTAGPNSRLTVTLALPARPRLSVTVTVDSLAAETRIPVSLR